MIGFDKFGKKREMEITTLKDNRLMLVDPSCNGFFDNVLGYFSIEKKINEFIEAVEEVKETKISPFWRPVLDPSTDDRGIIFMKGMKPACGYTFDWWKAKAKEIPMVEGKKWKIGTEYQYYAFLVHLINQLVENGWELRKALKAVVVDSKELGHYKNSEIEFDSFEPTGSRRVCGCYDLANTYKILRCTNKEIEGFWLASGYYNDEGNVAALADIDCNYLSFDYDCDWIYESSIGWLVLS